MRFSFVLGEVELGYLIQELHQMLVQNELSHSLTGNIDAEYLLIQINAPDKRQKVFFLSDLIRARWYPHKTFFRCSET